MDDSFYDSQIIESENIDIESLFNILKSKSLIDKLFTDDSKA